MAIIPSEHIECKMFWKWAQNNEILKNYLMKNCNEGIRPVHYVSMLLSIGMRPGVPDYQLPISNGVYGGLWIEMKKRSEVNRKKRDNQVEWMEKLNNAGHLAVFAYGWEHAAKICESYISNIK